MPRGYELVHGVDIELDVIDAALIAHELGGDVAAVVDDVGVAAVIGFRGGPAHCAALIGICVG